MGRNERVGVRGTREQRKRSRIPELGYYLIVTDTEGTERCFFKGLHDSLPKEIKDKLVIRVVETKTREMIDKCLEMTAYEAQYRLPWIVFDRDQVKDFDEIIQEAEDKGIRVGWSNPCFEIWMFAYFGVMPVYVESWKCCSEFGRIYEERTGQRYAKADDGLYGRLYQYGDEAKAVKLAEAKKEQCIRDGKATPSEMIPCSTVYELVGEIRRKGR